MAEIHPSIVALVAQQLCFDTGPIGDQAWQDRTGKRHRAEIRILFGFREPTVADGEAMVAWLPDHAVAHSHNPEHLAAKLKVHCRSCSIERPTPDRIERIVRAATHAYIGGMQTAITDVAIDPAGNVWVAKKLGSAGVRLQESAGAGSGHPLRRQRRSGLLRPGQAGKDPVDRSASRPVKQGATSLEAGGGPFDQRELYGDQFGRCEQGGDFHRSARKHHGCAHETEIKYLFTPSRPAF